MDEQQETKFRRRDLLIAVTAAGVATAMGAKALSSASTAGRRNKRRAQYQANSPGGPDFLPRQSLSGEVVASMLIKRSEQRIGRGASTPGIEAESERSLDRRSFLRRSGLIAGGLAGLGMLPLGSVRKAAAGAPPPPGATVTRRKNICTHCSVGCSVIAEVANDVWIGQEPDFDSPINRGSHCCKGAAVRDDVLGERPLRYPVKLVDGQWHRISWDQAIDEIGDKLLEIRAEVGTGFGLLAGVGQIHQ